MPGGYWRALVSDMRQRPGSAGRLPRVAILQQAVNLGDRLVTGHRGRVLHDFRGAEEKRLRVDDLPARFEDVRRAGLLDESAAEMPARVYV